MIKIAALNEESEEESDSEEEVTREALEQIALQQYAKALDLQRKGNLFDAMKLLNDLLETELLYEVKKPSPREKSAEPLFNLKYLCYKNVASMQSSIGENEKAIEAYTAAAELDDTDVTLWHRFGLTCIKAQEYEKALYVFQQGMSCNRRHWPCIDRIITLQMALGYYNDCIETIYSALELDPGYLRGLAYRRHIYHTYHYVRDFLIFHDQKYNWNEENDESIDLDKAEKLLKEAEIIHDIYIDQINKESFKYVLPQLKLRKPITNLTWQAVGDSLIHMHHYMTEHCYSHACIMEVNCEEPNKEEPMEVCEEPIPVPEETDKTVESAEVKVIENAVEEDKIMEIGSDDNNELSDKAATDTEKIEESDVEVPALETALEVTQTTEPKESNKKPQARRRGSALSFLQQWEWYTKRRSGRKKTANKQDQDDENIYETLRKMVPLWLVPDKSKENSDKEKSPEIVDIGNLFQNDSDSGKEDDLNYFGTEAEQKDVKEFIQKHSSNKCDIIEILKEYLDVLSQKWKMSWESGVAKTFVEANKCYANHIDMPSCCDQNKDDIVHYTFVNILCEEFEVAEKLTSNSDENQHHEIGIIENIGIVVNNKPSIYGADCFELMLRYLWVKLHVHLINKSEEQALDCLYQLLYEFESMGDHHDTYSLQLCNFKFKPLIKESEVKRYITFLERNKKLSTVLKLYDNGFFEDALTIVTDSFHYYKNNSRRQEEEMSLDFAVQLSLLIDCTWALKKVNDCLKWSVICLHEALKHYFLSQPDSPEQEQWSKTIVKILCSIEHILTTEGLLCLDNLTQKELSDALEDLIRIIGHQVDTNAIEMPFGTIAPWLILHYILQREDDHGRGRCIDKDSECDEIPNPILILFVAHEHLGSHSWCMHFNAKLLYFILDTVVPRLRSPSLSPSLEQITQHLEQCVFCLFGHPGKKTKLKYLLDHKVTPHSLDWTRAQQIYEIFKPPSMPELEGKIPSISAETEQLFHRILAIIPADCEPRKYVPEMEEYLNGKSDKLPEVPPLLPYKMKDIYFLLGDYYFKKEERKRSVKFNIFDIIVNRDRFESWAEIALAKGVNLELKLNSCTNLDNEKDYLDPARVIIRCFKRALELDGMYVNLWVEYGVFVYTVYSFCSRLLKHASESLSMQDFESLEQQKEIMLDQTQKCFATVLQGRLNAGSDEKDKENDEMWLHYYMMGKVAEKRNKPPAVFLNYYTKAITSLEEADAIYPSKINYNSPQHLSIEVLEIHYRIHASILKYIEHHENKPIPVSVGKVFLNSMKEWKNGPFTRKPKKDDAVAVENDAKLHTDSAIVHQAGNILKRSISDAGEEENQECKKLKLESAAAKVKRSASYDTERVSTDEISDSISKHPKENQSAIIEEESSKEVDVKEADNNSEQLKTNSENNKENKPQPLNEEKTEDTISGTSTMSSSDSSSDDTTTDSTTSTSRDTESTSKPLEDKNMSDSEIREVIYGCLDALEDCSSRFPQHYKAIYRLAHYHFYYKKGKDIERCRDLMLSHFMSRSNQKLGGLFNERKQTNFFNSVWRIPSMEVDRPGGFAYHMNRCVLLTMDILKEIDDHKTLLELSMHLQRVPDPDKKYLRDVDREDLAQQAFLLCVQSLKGQLLKFSQQLDLKSNEVEKQAFNSLMLDIHRAYLKAQKQPNSKQLLNLLIEGYKLICSTPINENTNLTDISLKYCQSLITALKQKATLASIDKNNQNAQKKQAAVARAAAAAAAAANIATTITVTTNSHSETIRAASQAKVDKSVPTLPNPDLAALMQSYHPLVSSQAAAAMLLYGAYDNYSLPSVTQPPLQSQLQNPLSSLPVSLQSALQSSIANPMQSSLPSLLNSLQNPLQSMMPNALQNSFQSEFYRLLLSSQYSQYNLSPPKKQRAKYTSSKSNSSGHTTQSKNASRPYSSVGPSSFTSHSRNIPNTVANISSSTAYVSHSKSNPSVSTGFVSSYTSLSNSRSSTTLSSSYTSHKNSTTSLNNALAAAYFTHARTCNSITTSSSRNITKMTPRSSMTLNNRNAYPHPSTGNKVGRPKSSNSCTIELTPTAVNSYSNVAKPAHAQSSSQGLHKSASVPLQAHISTSSTVNTALHSKPPLPHQQVSPGKTLQQKLAERQKHSIVKPSVQEINASLNRLPSSLTVTKTVNKKLEVVKSLSYDKEASRAKPTLSTDEIIVLDDD